MTQFKYVAYTTTGKEVKGNHEAETREEVADYLHSQGLTVVEINADLLAGLRKIGSIQIGGIPIKERVIFAKQLSIMLTAGVPVVQALQILMEQSETDYIKDKLRQVYDSIRSGNKLSEAFAQNDLFFNEVQLNLIAAGESSGNLNEMMDQIAEDLEKSQQLRGKIRGAMIYPTIVFLVLIVVIGIVVVFMIPSVQDLYNDLTQDAQLPWVTQILVDLSNTLTNPVGVLLTIVSVSGLYGAFRYYRNTIGGRRVTDRLMLRVPVFGKLVDQMQLAQFCRLLAMLMQSGVKIVEALNIVANALSNSAYQDVIRNASVQVTKGTPISVPLAADEVFPEILLKVIATGEDTGKLDQVLSDMGDYYTNEVNEITNNLTKLMEPIILLIVGGLVGFIAVAVYLPIYSLSDAIS